MSSNKRRKPDTPPKWKAACARAKTAFVARDGKLRAAWRLALALLGYIAWTTGVSFGLSYAFDRLFTAWGVTTRNLQVAPGYARFLAAHYGNIISIVSSAGVAVFAYLAAPRRDRLRFRLKFLGIGSLAGLAIVAVAALAFRALDSVRMTSESPEWSFSPLTLLPVYLAAAIAEEFFARGYVLRMVADRSNRPLGYLASALVFLYATGGYALGALGVVNMILFSLALCALSERWSSWLTAGVRFGWSFTATCLLAFPGASGAIPTITLYSVSEEWLTGGNAGLISGLSMTILLLAALYLLLIRGKLQLPIPRRSPSGRAGGA